MILNLAIFTATVAAAKRKETFVFLASLCHTMSGQTGSLLMEDERWTNNG
jgi:hypothetical protein